MMSHVTIVTATNHKIYHSFVIYITIIILYNIKKDIEGFRIDVIIVIWLYHVGFMYTI